MFIEATNADGSRTCAYGGCVARILHLSSLIFESTQKSTSPACVVGGSTNGCLCTDSQFIKSTRLTAPTPVPLVPSRSLVLQVPSRSPMLQVPSRSPVGDTRSQYTIRAPRIFCLDIYPLYGLTRDNFTSLNPTVNCIEPLPVGLVLTVMPKPGLTPCTVYYTTVQAGTQVLPTQAVCVERWAGAWRGQVISVCSQYYLVQSGEMCEAIRAVPSPPLSPLDLFRLNPGIKCSRLVPNTAGLDLHTGFECWRWALASRWRLRPPLALALAPAVGAGDRRWRWRPPLALAPAVGACARRWRLRWRPPSPRWHARHWESVTGQVKGGGATGAAKGEDFEPAADFALLAAMPAAQ
ncbi:unnamed protein product [Closterium sp. NIES-65]|nr:unnamed protein product [Closterium sp. NIES-65]